MTSYEHLIGSKLRAEDAEDNGIRKKRKKNRVTSQAPAVFDAKLKKRKKKS